MEIDLDGVEGMTEFAEHVAQTRTSDICCMLTAYLQTASLLFLRCESWLASSVAKTGH